MFLINKKGTYIYKAISHPPVLSSDHISTFLSIYDKGVTSERLSDLLANVIRSFNVRNTMASAVTMTALPPSLTPCSYVAGTALSIVHST